MDGQNIPISLKPEGSFPYSQQPTSGPYPLQDEFSPHPHTLFLQILRLSSQLYLCFPTGHFLQVVHLKLINFLKVS